MSARLHRNITIGKHSLKYTIWQGGPDVLLCFHGFGQDHTVYKSVYEALKETHSVYSFDLPFHGESDFAKLERPLTPYDWLEFMQLFFEREAVKNFEVMGYSMGGKYAMITTQLFPKSVKHLHLLAPDGITTHFSYKFSTYPFIFRKLFKTQIKHPWFFNGLVKFIRSLRLMNNYTLRFAESQMNTEPKRAQVYRTWVLLRHFLPELKLLAQSVNHEQAKVSFYLGQYDKVIHKGTIEPLVALLPNSETKVLESGHSQLVNAVAKLLSK